MVVLATASDPHHCVNRHWTAALGAIEGDEPSLTAGVAVHSKVTLVNNTKRCVILVFSKLAIL